MKYFKDPQGAIHGFDENHPGDVTLMCQIATGWTGITGSWPEPPTPAQLHRQLQAQAQAALDKTDLVAFRCFKAGIAYPPEWQAHTLALRAIVSGADIGSTSLPPQPAYPAGT